VRILPSPIDDIRGVWDKQGKRQHEAEFADGQRLRRIFPCFIIKSSSHYCMQHWQFNLIRWFLKKNPPLYICRTGSAARPLF